MDSMRFDLLKELSNIGSGGALTSLSNLVNENIQIHVPTIRTIEYDKISAELGYDTEDKLLGVLVQIEGELDLTLMFMLTINAANAFVSTLLGTPKKEDDNFDEMQISVIKEIGNIMFGAYLNTLSSMTQKNLQLSVPFVAIDMPQAILSVPASMFGEIGDKGIFVESVFEIAQDSFTAQLVMVPEKESFNAIAALMGVGM